MKRQLIKLKIEHQGAPIVNHGIVVKKGKGIAAIAVDMKSKWCEVDATSDGKDGSPAVWIGTTKRTVSVYPCKERDDSTKVCFPEYRGWDIFCLYVSRYSLKVCFVKKQKS